MQLFGIIKFEPSLICSKETLGQSVQISVAGNIGKLTLPALPEWTDNEKDPLHMVLIPPEKANTWKRGEEKLYWGSPVSYPSGESHVRKGLIEFNLTSEQTEQKSQDIYQEFPHWINLFKKYVVLLTKQNTKRNIEVKNNSNALELLLDNDGDLSLVSRKKAVEIVVYLSNSDESLHLDELKEACHFASSQFLPRLEYEMLLESYFARENADYRKAIIEAAAALEICLTSRIAEEFIAQKINFGEKLSQKYRMLSGKFELIRLLDIQIPDKDYAALILNPRNQVIHKAIYPDAKLANQVIREVEEILKRFSPIMYQKI